MNRSRLGSYLVTLCLLSLAATSGDIHAATVVKTDKKKQSFTLAPKSKKKSFIDFGKLGNKVSAFEKVEFKPKTKTIGNKKKKKPAAVFNFGEPVPDTAGGHTISVEMVSLSLVSINPVSLDPFLGKGSGQTGDLVVSLLAPKNKTKIPFDVKRDPKTGKKSKGKLDFKLDKKLKVSTNKNGVKKSKDLDKKKFKALGVGFSSASPITITDPSFCLENGDTASICLAPIPNPVPLPGSLALMAPALAILFTGHIIRRRRQNGGGPRLAA